MVSLSVQAQGWQVPKPSPGLMPNPAAGKTLFAKHCATCHGADLKGSDKGPTVECLIPKLALETSNLSEPAMVRP